MEFIDFEALRRSPRIDTLFPGWRKGETVAFFSPHDDDAALGAGYLVLATLRQGGRPLILVFCRGDAGYSSPQDRSSIVAVRKREARSAYRSLGVRAEDILFFDIPDFSLMDHISRRGRRGSGVFDDLIKLIRAQKISRVVFPNAHYEHWDHTAAFYQGIYTSPQAGDPILADLGDPFAIRSRLVYSVWGDFEAASGESRRHSLRADKGILADPNQERQVRAALRNFTSQGKIMENTVAILRKRRRCPEGYLELYKDEVIRKPIDFKPYMRALRRCRRAP